MKLNFTTAIFDMDGTLIDSMPSWRALNLAFARSHGLKTTPQQEEEIFQLSGFQFVSYLKEHFGLASTFEELCDEACAQMEAVYSAGVPYKPGAVEYLKKMKQRGIRCVIATATPARLALIALNRMGLLPYLDYVYSIDMVGGEKSDPEFFDRLCEKIGARKEDCAMFEDSLYAMRGARTAGIGCVIGINDSTNVTDREKFPEICDAVIDSFDELD